MKLMKSGKKWTEESLTRTAKLVETTGMRTFDVYLYDEKIGTMEYSYSKKLYSCRNLAGDYIGASNSKKESRFFVAWHHVGDESIEWGNE